MSREIRFRVWDGEKYLTEENCPKEKDEWWGSDYRIFLGAMKMAQGLWTLEQYTGLKDKDGTEIYEGDILVDAFGETAHQPVVWEGHGFWLIEPSGTRHMPEEQYREIIGNIHERP